MLFDIHTHALFSVDDGARTAEETAAILEKQRLQSVDAMVLTPHFYPYNETDVDVFMDKISAQFLKLKDIHNNSLPELFLGSEVYMFRGMENVSGLEKLCIGNSRYILLELPYDKISPWCINAIIEINLKLKLMPILAHIERYVKVDGFKEILALIDDGYALAQVNATPLLHFRTRRPVLKLIKNGFVSFIASDVHSNQTYQGINTALAVVEKKLGIEFANKIKANFDNLYLEIKNS